jgi:hypothetical protein
MLIKMIAKEPMRCPVCGSTNLSKSVRKSIVDQSDSQPVSVALTYRCDNGHVLISPSTQLPSSS